MDNSKREAAGIIPYIKYNSGRILFLLGKEIKRNNLLDAFIGGREPSDRSLEETAIREFNEETCLVYSSYLEWMKRSIKDPRTKKFRFETNSSIATVWFIEFPQDHDFSHDDTQFHYNLAMPFPPHYKEKSELVWVDIFNMDMNKLSINIRENWDKITSLFNTRYRRGGFSRRWNTCYQ